MRAKNHNIKPNNLKTRFNRGIKNHNLELLKHNLMFSLPMFMFFSAYFFAQNVFATATDSASVKMSVRSNYSIEVVLPSLDALTLTPSASGSFSSQDVTVSVGTNNPTGYTLTMSSDSTELTRSSAINGSTPTIATLESAAAEASFPTNRWGYKRTTGSTTDISYQPMLTNSSITLNNTEGPANAQDSQSTINFGVKLNNAIPSGTYSITLTFLAVANKYIEDTGLYMQDITLADCPSGEEVIVTDERDDGKYTIAQLDGVCVMTQNLRYIGGGEDVFSYLASGTGTRRATMENSAGNTFDAEFSASASYNPYFYFDASRSANYGEFIADDYGVYYNFATASGGTVTGTTNANDNTASICPAGWSLPRSSTDGSQTGGGISASTIADSGFFDTLAGLYNAGLSGDGYNAAWWSANAYDKYQRWELLNLNYGNFDTQMTASRNLLLSVRCILEPEPINWCEENDASYCMQEPEEIFADLAEGDMLMAMDARDGEEYMITRLNSVVVMASNLRYQGNLEESGTYNPAAAVNSAGSTFAMEPYTNYSYDDAYYYVSEDPIYAEEYGVYYNFAAASGGTIKGYENIDGITASVCPQGWTLPESNESTWGYILIDIIKASGLFDVFAGDYFGGTLSNDSDVGFWWASNATATTNRYVLYNVSDDGIGQTEFDRIYYALPVRCILE